MEKDRDNVGSVLEVIACTVEDAVAAERGGANRLEIIRDFQAGGYTPPLDLVREIASAVKLPLRVMLREEAGYGLAEVIAVEKLCCIANDLNRMKVDGVVIGFLCGSEVDKQLTRKILSCAPDLKATFHHAFEETIDKIAAIEDIKLLTQVDRILSHGGEGSAAGRITNLAAYAAAAGPEIEILAGGRIDLSMIGSIRDNTNIREFHVGTAARENGHVSEWRVRELVQAVRGSDA